MASATVVSGVRDRSPSRPRNIGNALSPSASSTIHAQVAVNGASAIPVQPPAEQPTIPRSSGRCSRCRAVSAGTTALLVACARRSGLIANATRWVSFAPLGPAGTDAVARIRAVETTFLSATRPGRTLGEVFAAGVRAYGEQGFRSDKWTRHHQGGPTGYAGRDPVATPDSAVPVVQWQAFAWNPSAPGVKTEDTVLLGDGGLEVLTADGDWPTTPDRRGLPRPDVLVR